MPWVKLDDGFLTNPKIMRAGLPGRALYVAGLCYCAGGLTDGLIPADALVKLGGLADVRRPSDAAERLVTVGLWEPVDEGYRVHDYLKYQPSADDVRKERQRVAEWRAKRGSERSTERVRNGVQNGEPDVSGTASTRDNAPARPGLTASEDAVPRPRTARRRAPDVAPPRRPPEDETTDPTALRPEQQQCPLCPEVFPDNTALREHLDNSPRHKVRPTPEDFSGRRPSSSKQPPKNGEEARAERAQVEAELAAMAVRPPLQPSELPPELLAEHERMLARERQRAGSNREQGA